MQSFSTSMSDGTQFHPPIGASSHIELTRLARGSAASAVGNQQPHGPARKLCCKTCQGKRCIGRCRF